MPLIEAIFIGIKPVILAVIIQALFRLGQTDDQGYQVAAVVLGSLPTVTYGVGEITILILSGLMMLLTQQLVKWRSLHLAVEPMSLTVLFLTFLKIGSVLYGSGYVLLAFLQAEFIDRYADQCPVAGCCRNRPVHPRPCLHDGNFRGLSDHHGRLHRVAGYNILNTASTQKDPLHGCNKASGEGLFKTPKYFAFPL